MKKLSRILILISIVVCFAVPFSTFLDGYLYSICPLDSVRQEAEGVVDNSSSDSLIAEIDETEKMVLAVYENFEGLMGRLYLSLFGVGFLLIFALLLDLKKDTKN